MTQMVHTDSINPTAFRTAKTLWSFDRSECNRVKAKLSMQPHKDPYHSPTYLNIPDNMGFYCSTPDNQTGSMYSVKNMPTWGDGLYKLEASDQIPIVQSVNLYVIVFRNKYCLNQEHSPNKAPWNGGNHV